MDRSADPPDMLSPEYAAAERAAIQTEGQPWDAYVAAYRRLMRIYRGAARAAERTER